MVDGIRFYADSFSLPSHQFFPTTPYQSDKHGEQMQLFRGEAEKARVRDHASFPEKLKEGDDGPQKGGGLYKK
jgi:hypothetical protein